MLSRRRELDEPYNTRLPQWARPGATPQHYRSTICFAQLPPYLPSLSLPASLAGDGVPAGEDGNRQQPPDTPHRFLDGFDLETCASVRLDYHSFVAAIPMPDFARELQVGSRLQARVSPQKARAWVPSTIEGCG